MSRMSKHVTGLVTVVLAVGLGLVSAGALGTSYAAPGGVEVSSAAAERAWDAPGHTIVRVTGDAANGFSIHRKDGTTQHPPTTSEAMAECSEYDTQVARVRCRTEVRTWYRDLGDMKRAINWARR